MFDKSQLPDLKEREEVFALHQAFERADEEANDCEDESQFRQLDTAREKAWADYAAHPLEIETDYEGNAARCGLCGAPLLSSDAVLIDNGSGEMFLRNAIPNLPPRKIEQPELELEGVQG